MTNFRECEATLSPFRPDFRYELSSDYRRFNSVKARGYCVVQIVATPVAFVFKTLDRLVSVATEIALAAKEAFKILAKFFLRLAGSHHTSAYYGEHFEKLGKHLISALDNTMSLVISPVALAAEEIRLLVGIINPAWAFTFRRSALLERD